MTAALSAGQDTADLTSRARAALQAAGDRTMTLNAFSSAAGYYRAALALWPDDAQSQRAGLLRLLGAMLHEAGDPRAAERVLADGSEAAAAAGLPALRARIQLLLAEIHGSQGRGFAEALAECEAAIATLEGAGDLEGLAEAWLLAGQLRVWLGESPADQEAVERALTYARRSGNRRAQMVASRRLVAILFRLPVPADVAVARAEQLLQEGSGEPWAEADALMWLAPLYALPIRAGSPRPGTRSPAASQMCAGFGPKIHGHRVHSQAG